MAISKKAPSMSKTTSDSTTTVKTAASSNSIGNTTATTATGAAISKVVSSSSAEATATKASYTNAASVTKSYRKPDTSAIAARAYFIWKSEGCPEGHQIKHWLQAEKELSER